MKAHYHTAASLAASAILYLLFKSWGMAAACFVSGVFIDLDHILDYLREQGWPFKVRRFFEICHNGQFDRIMLIWHGWEWLALWSLAAWVTDWNPLITGALIGIALHMIMDTLHNCNSPISYSLLWRWQKGFVFDEVFPKIAEQKYAHRQSFRQRTQ